MCHWWTVLLLVTVNIVINSSYCLEVAYLLNSLFICHLRLFCFAFNFCCCCCPLANKDVYIWGMVNVWGPVLPAWLKVRPKRLHKSYALGGRCWTCLLHICVAVFNTYNTVRTSAACCTPSEVLYGVPQGSVLGPILLFLYAAELLQLVKRHQLIPHTYADDTQIYGFCRPADSAELCEKVSVCVDEVLAWTASNRLQLNHAKTEVFRCSSSRRQHPIPSGPVRIGSTDVQTVSLILDLGPSGSTSTLTWPWA